MCSFRRAQGIRQHTDQGPQCVYICMTGGLPAIPRDAPQRRAVALFFSEMYQSAAEPLPDHALDPGWLDAPRPDQAVVVLDPPLEDGGPLALSSVLLSTANLPVRYLPPGRPRDLYWQYLAWHDHLQEGFGGEEGDDPDAGDTLSGCPRTAASWPTFWRTWSDNWKDVIKFRKSSQHTRCNVCHDFEQALHRSRGNLPEKVALARRLREHLRDQYLDRTIYWNMRWLSRNRCSEGVVTIIVDSMDKQTFAVPRYGFSKLPKYLEKFHRPRLTCCAAICHGWVTTVMLADENVQTGGNLLCEVVLRTLEKVQQIARSSGRPPPNHVVLQVDNTVAQAKNAVAFNLMSLLVGRGLAATSNLWFLREGHTHEDIGANQPQN